MTLRRIASTAGCLLVPLLLVACSDQRASVDIDGSAHALSLIRITTWPWDKTAKYSVVAARMPDCQRRHPMGEAPLEAKFEVYSPGNNAWIIKQGERMFVVETRSCEGFAPLAKAPEGGLGALLGNFAMRCDTLVFTPAPAAEAPPPVLAPAAKPAT